MEAVDHIPVKADAANVDEEPIGRRTVANDYDRYRSLRREGEE